MAKINLLNWREEKRKQVEQQFYVMLVAAALFGAAVVFAMQTQLDRMIEYQESRNQYIQSEIKKVERAIAEIKVLEKKKEALLARMNVIQNLQSDRSDSVHLLDELVKVIPEGVHLDSFKQQKKALTFTGIAQSNARVSAYMRNIERAEWLASPNLRVIQSNKKSSEGYSRFTLTAQQASPEEKKKKDKEG